MFSIQKWARIKGLVLAAACIFIVACNDLEGTLNVAKEFSITGNRHSSNQTISLSPGYYKTKISLLSDSELALKLTSAGVTKTVKLDIPEGSTIPDEGGPVQINGIGAHKELSINGRVSLNSQNSEVRRSVEFCQYQTVDYVCTVDGAGHQVCTPIVRYIDGRRDVEYYVRTTTKSTKLNFVDNRIHEQVAVLNGEDSTTERIFVYTGVCR